MLRRQEPVDALQLRGRGRVRLLGLLAGQLHGHAIPSGVRLHACVVEDHGDRGHRLTDRLASLVLAVQGRHEVGDPLRGECIEAGLAEEGQRPVERGAVLDRCRLSDVHTGGLPPRRRLRERRRELGISMDRQVRDAHRGQLTRDPLPPDRRLASRLEGARVPAAAPVAVELEANPVAQVSGRCLPPLDPGTSHGRGGIGLVA